MLISNNLNLKKRHTLTLERNCIYWLYINLIQNTSHKWERLCGWFKFVFPYKINVRIIQDKLKTCFITWTNLTEWMQKWYEMQRAHKERVWRNVQMWIEKILVYLHERGIKVFVKRLTYLRSVLFYSVMFIETWDLLETEFLFISKERIWSIQIIVSHDKKCGHHVYC